MYPQLYTYDRKDVGVEMGRKVFGTGKKKFPESYRNFLRPISGFGRKIYFRAN